MRISAEQVPSLHMVATRYLELVTFSNFLPFNANKKYLHCLCLALFCADFHSICRCSVYESVGEVLKFTFAAAHTSAQQNIIIYNSRVIVELHLQLQPSAICFTTS